MSKPEQTQLPPKKAAEYLRVAEETLYKWRRRGLGPRYVRRVGRVYYDIQDLAEWNKFGDFVGH